MYSGGSTRALPRVGFPIRRSRGQRLVSTSPELFAAAHVLHRLSAPRHPPCALVLLIEKNTFYHYGVFKVRSGWLALPCANAPRLSQQSASPSKLNSVILSRSTCSRRAEISDGNAIDELDAYGSKSSRI